MNASGSESLREECAEAAAIIAGLTRCDEIVVSRAREIFAERHRSTAASYDLGCFESRHASSAVARLHGNLRGESMAYSVRGPVIGSGFHPRDGAGQPSCAIWSGPGSLLRLYVPVPKEVAITVIVWVRGYAADGVRSALAVSVDGEPVPHRFEEAAGWAEALLVDVRTHRDFVRLEIDTGGTHTYGNPGDAVHDSRLRGITFDSYGWRLS
jgi:hypothetical protein